MLRRAVAWLAFACACACAPTLGACSLLLGEGFTDPNADSANDSGTGTPDGDGGTTPGTDARPNDGQGPGTDSGSKEGGTQGCPSAAVSLCDDFERTDVQGDWGGQELTAGGSLAIGGQAPNRNLAASITTKGALANLTKTFALKPTKFHFELTMQYDAYPQEGAVHLFGMLLFDPANPSSQPSIVYAYVRNDGVHLVQQLTDGMHYHEDPIAITIGAKHRVVIDGALNGKVVVTVDGTPTLDANMQTYLISDVLTLSLGASASDGTGAGFALTVDDFVFTAD